MEITDYFKYEPIVNGVFSRNNLTRIRLKAYVINLDDKNSKGVHWVSLLIDRNTAVYFGFYELNIFLKNTKQNQR